MMNKEQKKQYISDMTNQFEKSNNTVKGDLIKQAFITSTMGVSYKIKLGKSI